MGTGWKRQDCRILKLKEVSEFRAFSLSRHRASLSWCGEESGFSNNDNNIQPPLSRTSSHFLLVTPQGWNEHPSIPFTDEERVFLAQRMNTVNSEFKGLFGAIENANFKDLGYIASPPGNLVSLEYMRVMSLFPTASLCGKA